MNGLYHSIITGPRAAVAIKPGDAILSQIAFNKRAYDTGYRDIPA